MTIEDVKVWTQDMKLGRPYTIAYQHIDRVANSFLTVRLSDGTLGLGAASPGEQVTGESMAACVEALDQLADRLRGKDIRQFQHWIAEAERTFPGRPAARAAFDMALHDAFCRWLGLPLANWLGRVHDGLPTSVTLGIGPSEEAVREGREFLAQGFRALKLKTGREVEADLDTCRALRADLGFGFALRVDANQGYTAETLQRFARHSAELAIEFIEQPLPKDAVDRMRNLPPELSARCAADESLQQPSDALALAHPPLPFGIYNIKLMKCGGIAAAREMAAVARHAGIDLMWGCNDESAVSIAAALHVALACPATRYLDLDGSLDLLEDVVEGGFELRDGSLRPRPEAGLGTSLRKAYLSFS